jgi:hypothetical protein
MLSDIWCPPCGTQRDGDQPAVRQHGQDALVLAQAVGEGAVELEPVPVRAHAAVAQQVAGVLVAEQVLARRHRPGVELGQRRLQRVVERVAGLLVPEQRVVAEHPGVGDRRLEVEAAVGVDASRRRLPISASTASMRSRSASIESPPIFILTTV